MANAPQMIGPLGMGQLDVGAGTVAASLYNAVAQNIAIRAVADKGSMRPGYGFSGLMVRKDLVDSGRFKTYADLKGMKLAVGTFGSANASAMNEALKKGGLKWSDAASIVALRLPAAHRRLPEQGDRREHDQRADLDQRGAGRARGAHRRQRRDLSGAADRGRALFGDLRAHAAASIALKFMRAYIRAVREYNDALKDGRIAGPNADEVISVLTEYTFIKDAKIHRSITPAAIDPDGRMSLEGLRNDLAFFKEQKLIAGSEHDGRAHHRHVVRRAGGEGAGAVQAKDVSGARWKRRATETPPRATHRSCAPHRRRCGSMRTSANPRS